MKRYSMISLLLLCLFLTLTGCEAQGKGAGKGNKGADEFLIYYRNSDSTSPLTTDYEPTASGDAMIRQIFDIMTSGQFADGQAAIPAGLSLARSAWQEHSLVLYLTGDYPPVGSAEEMLCRYALVQTFYQIPDVEGVTILINDQPLLDVKGREFGILTPDDFLSDVKTSGNEERPILCDIYFADPDGVRLKACQMELKSNGTFSLEKQMVDQLIDGPQMLGYFPVMPMGTKALSVSVHDRICYVNLNSSFTSNELSTPARVRVYAIVNTLTGLEEVDSVQLMVNGATNVSLDNVSLTAPLERDSSLCEEAPEEETK